MALPRMLVPYTPKTIRIGSGSIATAHAAAADAAVCNLLPGAARWLSSNAAPRSRVTTPTATATSGLVGRYPSARVRAGKLTAPARAHPRTGENHVGVASMKAMLQ